MLEENKCLASFIPAFFAEKFPGMSYTLPPTGIPEERHQTAGHPPKPCQHPQDKNGTPKLRTRCATNAASNLHMCAVKGCKGFGRWRCEGSEFFDVGLRLRDV